MIGSRAGLSFNDFLLHMAPIAMLLVVVFAVMARWMFRSVFVYDAKRAAQVMEIRERDAIKDGRLLAVSGAVVVIVMVCFVLHTTLHLEPSVVAISGGLVLLAVSRLHAREVAGDVEWETLAFFTGLFVMVGAMVETGIITDLGQAAARATEGQLFGASMALLFGSIVPSAVIDNIPFVTAVTTAIAGLYVWLRYFALA
jgi:Na+/H+ antiporter NhaD/arsenite permease-like protein